MPMLPYTKPGSPLGRFLALMGRVRLWIREGLPDERRGALIATVALPPLVLLLSALVSMQMLTLSVAALSTVILEWRTSGKGYSQHALHAALEIGLSWLAGHVVMAPLTPISLVLACCFATAYQGVLTIQYPYRPGRPSRTRSLLLLLGGQVAAGLTVLLFGRRVPLLGAAALGFLIAPQLLLLAGASPHRGGHAYARRVAPFLMAALPIAAWTA
jgi:hypothetical protein